MVKYLRSSIFGLLVASAASSLAQGAWVFCRDPNILVFPPAGYLVSGIANPLFGVSIGVAGGFTLGGTPKFPEPPPSVHCDFPNNETVGGSPIGSFGFSVGPVGSIQTDWDDNMPLNFGGFAFSEMPWSYWALVGDGGTFTLPPAPTLHFVGASDRYFYNEYTMGNFRVQVQGDQIGDGVRIQYEFNNTDILPHDCGLWWGQWPAMASSGAIDYPNIPQAISMFPYIVENPGSPAIFQGFVVSPGQKPYLTERRFVRTVDPTNFPPYVNFNFSEDHPYGIKVNNGPLDQTVYDIEVTDHPGISADTQADEIVVGQEFFLLGGPTAGAVFPDFIFAPITNPYASDVLIGNDYGYIQKFYPKQVAGGGQRAIIQYFNQVWGVVDYVKPYAAIVDAPRVLAFDPTGQSLNGILPNPGSVRVWVDNTRGFSTFDQQVDMQGVQVTMRFRQSTGLTFAAGQNAQSINITENGQPVPYWSCTKLIATIKAADIQASDFSVISDGNQNGKLPYQVIINPTPGPTKILNGEILATVTPKYNLVNGANLVAFPWKAADSSWAFLLGLSPAQFTAYSYDPARNGYVPSTSAERGKGAWLIVTGDQQVNFAGNVTQYPDLITGPGSVQLKSGWNLIGDPYNYPVQLGTLVGVSNATPTTSNTYAQLVALGLINASLAYWNPDTQSYQFIAGNEALMLPNLGYWLFVSTAQDFILQYPSLDIEGLPDNALNGVDGLHVGRARSINNWQNSDTAWRLQLVARSSKTVDDKNYVGVVTSTTEAKTLNVVKPPMGPTQDVALSVEALSNGRALQMAQAVNTGGNKQNWKVNVTTTVGGTYTLTWPNLRNIPGNLKARLVDTASGVTRDMRQTAGYTFTAKDPGTRSFTIQTDTGGTSVAVIGNVTVSRPTRDPNGAFAISYTLSSDATTSVRVLNAGGAEIFSITRGRADRVGENSVTWNLRDSANRSVAPGTYRVEIVAETSTGDRVRKIVPINVIR